MLTAAWVAYCVVLACLGIYGAHRLHLVMRYWRSRGAALPETPPLPRDLPVVTVQLPLFNEMYVAERLIDAVAALDWPRDRLEIQILDDSTDQTRDICSARAETLRAAGYDIQHLHRDDRQGFKAGALEAGLRAARGDLVLILDADFVPPAHLLRHTVGHFTDAAIGMVQVRWEHLNRDYSVLTRVQAMLLDGHFVVEQATRARAGCFFNFNGTAGLWRRAAIEQAGGWHHDTLTEDLDLSYRALLCGWRFVYLLGSAAPAELPVDMNAFKSQQFRWAKGSVQVARKLLPRVARAPVGARVKLEAFFHLTQNLPYLLTFLLILLAFPALVVRPGSTDEALWLHLPALVLTVLALGAYCMASQHALARSAWAAAFRLPALIGITAGICLSQSRAVIEGLLGHGSEFIRTPKHGVIGRGAAPLLLRARIRSYRGLRGLVVAGELAMAAYAGVALGLTVAQDRWLGAPFWAVLCAGFAYVGLASALRR